MKCARCKSSLNNAKVFYRIKESFNIDLGINEYLCTKCVEGREHLVHPFDCKIKPLGADGFELVSLAKNEWLCKFPRKKYDKKEANDILCICNRYMIKVLNKDDFSFADKFLY